MPEFDRPDPKLSRDASQVPLVPPRHSAKLRNKGSLFSQAFPHSIHWPPVPRRLKHTSSVGPQNEEK